jgi:Condensation domain
VQTLDETTATLAPLSYSEEAAWHELETNPRAFFLRGLTLTVPMPPGAQRAHAERVVAALVARHEIFRTAYRTIDGRPRRLVYPDFHHDIIEADKPVYGIFSPDLANLRPNDLFRAWLTPGPDGTTKLSVDLNEMITDSWSCGRMHGELAGLVDTYAAGREPEPGTADAGYSGFAREQREQPLAEPLIRYWQTKLAGVGRPAYLAEDGPDPSGEPVGERVYVFHDDLTEAVKTICTRHRLSRFMAVVALVKVVLASRSGARDITLCTTTGTRAARYTDVHGNFSNLLALRTVLPPDPTFAELASLTRNTVVGALTHQEMPFLELKRAVGVEIEPPPVRVAYLPHRLHHYAILDAKESGAFWPEEAMFATWPLEIGFAEDGHGRFATWFNYDASRYSHASMERLIRDFGHALRAIAGDSELTCTDLRSRLDP